MKFFFSFFEKRNRAKAEAAALLSVQYLYLRRSCSRSAKEIVFRSCLKIWLDSLRLLLLQQKGIQPISRWQKWAQQESHFATHYDVSQKESNYFSTFHLNFDCFGPQILLTNGRNSTFLSYYNLCCSAIYRQYIQIAWEAT